jgi:2-polyprenyl-3-methyl-5-hydroxy-6-metoxy-1,4-benzoquinol methylase
MNPASGFSDPEGPTDWRTKPGESCPLCGSKGIRLFRAEDHWVRECNECAHRWAEIDHLDGHIDRVYDDAYFSGGGAGYPDYVSERQLLIENGRRYGRLLSKYIKQGRVLDIGAAAGFLLRGMEDEGWIGVGIEPNRTMAMYARENLGLEVLQIPFEEYRTDDQFDAVSMIQVLPHILNITMALDTVNRVTTPGGCWLVETWNCRSLTARICGRHWHEYSPPSVVHWFSPSTLRRTAENHGFEFVATGRPEKRISGAHFKSLFHFKLDSSGYLRPFGLIIDLIPDTATLWYPAEDLFWMLFRKKR